MMLSRSDVAVRRSHWFQTLGLFGSLFFLVCVVEGQETKLSDLKYQFKVGVLPMVDNTGSGGEEVALALSRAVQSELAHSTDLVGRVLKLDEGLSAEDLDGEKAVEIGRARKVDVVLLGTVLEAESVEVDRSVDGRSILGQSVGGSARSVKATVTLQGDLYNTTTGKKLNSFRVTGKASDTKVGTNVYTSLGAMSTGDVSFDRSSIGKALHSAVTDLVKKIAAEQPRITRYKPRAGGTPQTEAPPTEDAPSE